MPVILEIKDDHVVLRKIVPLFTNVRFDLGESAFSVDLNGRNLIII